MPSGHITVYLASTAEIDVFRNLGSILIRDQDVGGFDILKDELTVLSYVLLRFNSYGVPPGSNCYTVSKFSYIFFSQKRKKKYW